MRPIEIATTGPYAVFFLLALLVGLGIAWSKGGRQGAPAAEWAAILAVLVTAGMVGARFLHFDPGAGPGAKTILGGVLLATVALYSGVRFLRLDPGVVDALALALPVGFAIGRIGCLLAGCCFGHPTDLPWGVVYGEHSAAFRSQMAAGLVSPGAKASLPVHPTQIYEALLALFIAAGVPRMSRIVKREGSLLLTVLLALGLGRLLIEFLRAREIATVGGLTRVQWLLSAVVFATGFLLVWREIRPAPGRTALLSRRESSVRLACVAFAPALVLLASGAFFAPLERLALTAVAIPALLLWIGPRLLSSPRRAPRLATPPAAVFVLALLTFQEEPPDYPRTDWTLGLSVAESGDNEDRVVGMEDGCDGPVPTYAEYDVRYRLLGAMLTRTTESSPDRSTSFRLRSFLGNERSVRTNSPEREVNTALGGLGGSMTFDGANFGGTAGLAVGRFSSDTTRTSFNAILGLRVGNLDGVHAFAGLNDIEPLGIRDVIARAGVGYTFGPDGSTIQAGAWESGRPFLGGTLVVGSFEISPNVVISEHHDVRLSIGRRLGRTKTP